MSKYLIYIYLRKDSVLSPGLLHRVLSPLSPYIEMDWGDIDTTVYPDENTEVSSLYVDVCGELCTVTGVLKHTPEDVVYVLGEPRVPYLSVLRHRLSKLITHCLSRASEGKVGTVSWYMRLFLMLDVWPNDEVIVKVRYI